MLPFVFLKEERRWAPRRSVFLEPPNLAEERLIWNARPPAAPVPTSY